jgi:lipopolysaccharide transport system ATP-binding protein
MSDPIIAVEHLGKQYRIRHQQEGQRYVALRDVLTSKFAAPLRWFRQNDHRPTTGTEDFWALKDVSFEVKQGEVVGIIGRNGAGKSTLLKILSRITEPTKGRVTLEGRVASLLEVGTGFHPELTGRENIFLNGAILGMTHAEITRKFDEIVAFAEVEKFLDTPVKRYSSGMYVRLAFAVAAHLEPEILIVDEVLAVGDAEFQKKCLGKMHEVSKGGRTVLFVSHNIAAIQALSTKVIYLQQGTVEGFGEVNEWIATYLSSSKRAVVQSPGRSVRMGEALELVHFHLTPNPAESGARVGFSLEILAHQATKVAELAFLIYSSLGTRIAIIDFRSSALPVRLTAGQIWTMNGWIKTLPLVEGEYRFGLYIGCGNFVGDVLDLVALSINSQTHSGAEARYPAAHRGVLELEFAVGPTKLMKLSGDERSKNAQVLAL